MASVAVPVAATAPPGPVPTVSSGVRLTAESESTATALLMTGAGGHRFSDAHVATIMDQFVRPLYPDETFADPVAVTTPGEAGPITGLLRLLGSVTGDPSLGGPGGEMWPDDPWWRLTGLFDRTADVSAAAGMVDLERDMAAAQLADPTNKLVIYGYSQGSATAVEEKKKLAEQYPVGTEAPDIEFVFSGDTHVPNGGLYARFPGLFIPVIDWHFNGPEPTDTQFKTTSINRQYDGIADFPLYPLNVLADLNAVMGFLYVHTWPFDVSLADPSGAVTVSQKGDTTYYLFETKDLPLFSPLRQLGVPESVIDVIEPVTRVLVELGYDRTIPAGEPTPARLFPTKIEPAKVIADLARAVGEGAKNAVALFRPSAEPAVATAGSSERPGAERVTAEPAAGSSERPAVQSVNAEPVADGGPAPSETTKDRPQRLRAVIRDALDGGARMLDRARRTVPAERDSVTETVVSRAASLGSQPAESVPSAQTPSDQAQSGRRPVLRQAGERAAHRVHTAIRNATGAVSPTR